MTTVTIVLATGLTLVLVSYVFQFWRSSLRSIPGPILAKFTNIWRLLDVWHGRSDLTLLALHRKHGPAVQIGPNCVSLNDPALIRTIYSTKDKWIKSKFYRVNDQVVGGRIIPTVFSVQDEDLHTAMMNPIRRLYSLTSILRFEPLMDRTIETFMTEISRRFAMEQKRCPIDLWLHYCALDIMGEMTASRTLGFLENAKDMFNLIRISEQSLDYFAVVGQIPVLDKFLDKSYVRIGPPSIGPLADFAATLASARLSGEDKHDAKAQRDMLDDFVAIQKADSSIQFDSLISWTAINVIAGSDTVATALRAIVYFLCKRVDFQARLHAELDNAQVKANATPPQWKVVSKLRYLDAVIREAIRLHPSVGLPLERLVPESGLKLADGRSIPAGTVVGMSAWVVHKDPTVFGDDVDSFLPDRWLQHPGESVEDFESRVGKMKDSDLVFGFGKRACLGKNIALLELYKMTASLFAQYEVRLVNSDKEWTVRNAWFVRQSDMDVFLTSRRK